MGRENLRWLLPILTAFSEFVVDVRSLGDSNANSGEVGPMAYVDRWNWFGWCHYLLETMERNTTTSRCTLCVPPRSELVFDDTAVSVAMEDIAITTSHSIPVATPLFRFAGNGRTRRNVVARNQARHATISRIHAAGWFPLVAHVDSFATEGDSNQ